MKMTNIFCLLFLMNIPVSNLNKSKRSFLDSINKKFYNDNEIKFKKLEKNIKYFLENQTNIKRKLNEDESYNAYNISNSSNISNINNNTNKSSGVGWIETIIIIILSIIVIYVLFIGFRYYRRKKYQNPSFYYKITEEMFEDITPIE